MDEASLIRRQHDVELAHLREAVQALDHLKISGDLTTEITITYSDYIIRYIRAALSRFEAMAQQLTRKAALAPQDRGSLENLAKLKRASEIELAQLEQSTDAAAPARAALEIAERMRALVTPLVEQHFALADWRQSARFDADSMLEERQRFAQLMALRRDRNRATPA
jgi:vacuolar-type H+-ATPase subunit I/STV1